MDKNSKIYIAGHTGLIGSAIYEKLLQDEYTNLIVRTKKELDLTNQYDTKVFFEEEKPEYVFLCAGLVGSLYSAEIYKSEYIYQNMMIEANIINASFENDVIKLIFFAPADIYSRILPQPYKESDLVSGQVDFNTNSFVLSKIATLKMCESYNSQYGTDFICMVISNLYGKKQLYDTLNSTVVPALIKRFYDAKVALEDSVKVWGTGKAIRNFIYIDDLVDGSIHMMNTYCDNYIYNISHQNNITIEQLANIIKHEVEYEGDIVFDSSKPEGVISKTVDTTQLKENGFECIYDIKKGIHENYMYFINQVNTKSLKQKNITKISISQKDKNIFDKLKPENTNNFIQPKDYKNKVVLKPWGYEFLIFENEYVAVWFLFIKNGFSTSMHSHPLKKTSLVVLDGQAYCNTFANKMYLNDSEAVIIDKGVFHSTKSLSEDGLFLIELETPPNKTDLVRLQDRYGRQNSGYEGTSEMKESNLEEFNYFNFLDDNNFKQINEKKLKVDTFTKISIKNFTPSSSELILSFKGSIINSDTKELILGLADAQYGYKFTQQDKFEIDCDEICLLRIKDTDE